MKTATGHQGLLMTCKVDPGVRPVLLEITRW